MSKGSEAVTVTKRLAQKLGVPYGHYISHETEPDLAELDVQGMDFESPTAYKVKTRDGRWLTTQPSALEAEHNGTYGGWVIEQIAPNGRTWVSRPYGDSRRPLRSFVAYVNGIISQLEAGQ